MPELKIVLPWPDMILNPNQHVHWSKKHKAQQTAREAGFYIAKEAGVELDPEKRYDVQLVFCPPDKRSRDLDNLTSACKHFLDGICAALRINDKMIKPVPDWGERVKRGQVRVTITEKVEA